MTGGVAVGLVSSTGRLLYWPDRMLITRDRPTGAPRQEQLA